MLISREKRFLFVHIQKTAGISIRSALERSIPDLRPLLGTHDTASQAREHLGDAEYGRYFTAAFVRNPWDRLVSWYTMIVQRSERLSWWRRRRSPGYIRLWQYVHENSRDFEGFVRNCTDEIDDVDGRKSFTRNQVDYISDGGRLIVDFVGRYERLDDDARRLFERLGLPPAELPRANTSRHDHYGAYYSDELAELVGRRFARDVEAFGYRFERREG
jgi:hypothetical protein